MVCSFLQKTKTKEEEEMFSPAIYEYWHSTVYGNKGPPKVLLNLQKNNK